MAVAAVAIATALTSLGPFGPASAGSVAPCGWTMASKSKSDKASRASYDWPAMNGTVSANGRYIAFSTDAHNLTLNDDDRHSDVFVRDLTEGTIKLVGRGVKGRNLNDDAWGGMVTPDGKYLLFSTGATNVHPAADGTEQIYRRNLRNGRVRLVSRGVTGEPANISTGGGAITPNGRYVVFTSPGTNMLYGQTHSNDFSFHSYVRDIKKGKTTVVSVDRSGRVIPASARSISRDGRLVTFATRDVFLRNLERKRTYRISKNYDGSPTKDTHYASNPFITPSGRHIMFTSRSPKIVRKDTNGAADVFVYARRTKEVTRVSVGNGGREANRVSQGMSISNDGSVVTFVSRARNLDRRVTWDWNGFAHDLVSGRTRLFTICDDGTANTGYQNPDPIRISGNAKRIVIAAQSSNFAPESSQGPQFRYQVYHRRFSILPPTVLTTTGPYNTDPGIPVDLDATVLNRKGNPLDGVVVKFRVATKAGEIVWRTSATTDAAGHATVSHVPSLESKRYVVTTIVPATDTHARAEMTDELAVGV